MSDLVLTRVDGGVLIITLNRPSRKNALTGAMYTMLAEAIECGEQDRTVRVILLTGAGESFCAGNDLEDFARNSPPVDGGGPAATFMRVLFHCDKPVVASVQGHAVGIGTTMLLHCDLVYAGESACFQLPFANLGLCPEYASSLILPRLVGTVKAAELLMMGEPFSAREALDYGIANQVVNDNQLTDFVRERCQHLVAQPPGAIRATKRLLREPQRQQAVDVMAREIALFEEGLKSAEFREAATAFFEKRQPDFSSFS